MADTHGIYIDGQWKPARAGQTFEQRNPADLDAVTGRWPACGAEDVDDAVQSAARAAKPWADLTVHQRAEVLRGALRLMRERTDAIAAVLTAENGKTLAESRSEIASAAAEMEFQIAQGLRTGGQVLPSSRPGVLAYSIRCPLGPVAVIAPWNFPFNVPSRKCTPALISGNTCVLKPAHLTPGVGEAFVRLFDDAGIPPGVVNFVTGSGSVVGDALVRHPLIRAVSFTGSTAVGRAIHRAAAEGMKRTQLEMGGKNPLVVLDDADLPAAADAACQAAFACAGQWCTSTSRVIVHRDVCEEFLSLLLQRVDTLRVGPGDAPASTMGPVCGEAQMRSILVGIEKGLAEGATLVRGGRRVTDEALARGCFIEPTVFTDVTTEMSLAQEEIFGPVLAILAVGSFDEAVEAANAVEYGLASSVFTRNIDRALEFVRRSEVGLAHVNMLTAYKEPQLPFGGVKASGFGLPEAGESGIEFFTEHKTVYVQTGL